jgi:hypothetical protein
MKPYLLFLHVRIETKVVLEFKESGKSHKYEFNIKGDNFEGIKTTARELELEIRKSFPAYSQQKAIESHIKIGDEEIPLAGQT